MNASAILIPEPNRVELAEIRLPDLRPNDLRVRALRSGVSIGTESLFWSNRLSRRCAFPCVLGYQAIGVVEEIGRDVTDIAPGDTVVYRNARLEGPVADRRGCHASYGIVPRPAATRAPEGINPNDACLFVMPGVALHGVTRVNVTYTDVVAVHGLGLIGLNVVAMSRLRGATIVGIDIRPDRLQAAKALGADQVIDASGGDLVDAFHNLYPDGADIVFETTGIGKCIDIALPLTRRGGSFALQGNYGDEQKIPFSFLQAHESQHTWYFPAGEGGPQCRQAVLELIARGALSLEPAITHRVTPEQAVDVYAGMMDRTLSPLGIVISWS